MTRWAGHDPAARRILLQTQAQSGRARLAQCWRGVEHAAARREAQAIAAVGLARDALAVAATVAAWRALKRYPRTNLVRRGFGVYAIVRALGRATSQFSQRPRWEDESHGRS